MTDLPNADPESRAETLMASPDRIVKVREAFGVDSDMEVPAFSEADERVPDLDPTYVFDPNTTLAICAGFSKNRRVRGRFPVCLRLAQVRESAMRIGTFHVVGNGATQSVDLKNQSRNS